jgi:hypothetical protein
MAEVKRNAAGVISIVFAGLNAIGIAYWVAFALIMMMPMVIIIQQLGHR